MTESATTRVAVYLDFDNIVISRYDQVHGRNSFHKDKANGLETDRLQSATVDVGAIIDFASSFGTLVLTRAYADWSADVNAAYHGQLVGRAVDLVQLFPAAAYGRTGGHPASVDAVEDMFRLPDLTHVVIVGGDSDYIALAQRCKRLGRYVVGIGVAGASSRSLAAACDEFVTYDALPGISTQESRAAEPKGGHGVPVAATPTTTRYRPIRRRRPPGCSNARCASVRTKTTPSGCTTRPSKPDETDGSVVQRKGFGFPVFQRLPQVPWRPRPARRDEYHPFGTVTRRYCLVVRSSRIAVASPRRGAPGMSNRCDSFRNLCSERSLGRIVRGSG